MPKTTASTTNNWENAFDELLNDLFFGFTTDGDCNILYSEGYGTDELKSFISKTRAEAKLEVLEEIDPFDLVEDCHPDCTPNEHAYHEGTWMAHISLQQKLNSLKQKYRQELDAAGRT